MSQYPTQIRTVDPFASYNSDMVNKLTRMVTQGEDLLFSPRSIDVIADSTSPNDFCTVKSGSCFKDDMWIQITEEHQVDFSNALHYFGGSIIKESGYYYIVLEYNFIKSRPAPQASIKIIPPSLLPGAYGAGHIFLKAISATTGPWALGTFYDYDPDNPTTVQRQSTSTWASFEHTLPIFEQTNDQGRIIYVKDANQFYFGRITDWISLEEWVAYEATFDITTSTSLYSLIYHNGSTWVNAIATTPSTFAQAIVLTTGVAATGKWDGVVTANVEGSLTISPGDILYLSESSGGTITNVKTSQQVGVALTGGIGGTITMLFSSAGGGSGGGGSLRIQLSSWTSSGSDYYKDINISSLGPLLISDGYLVQCWDNSSGELIDPMLIDRTTLTNIRVWMPVNTVTLNVVISG